MSKFKVGSIIGNYDTHHLIVAVHHGFEDERHFRCLSCMPRRRHGIRRSSCGLWFGRSNCAALRGSEDETTRNVTALVGGREQCRRNERPSACAGLRMAARDRLVAE